MTVALFVVAGVVAVLDWVAVDRQLRRAEYVLKPATMALLIAAAASTSLGVAGPWLIAGLAFGLVGDIGLMLAGDKPDLPFVGGLGAFLIGHLCYLVAFARFGLQGLPLLAGALVAVGIAGLMLPQVLRGADRAAGRPFAIVVAAYAAVLAAMTALAAGTQLIAVALGGVLFLLSDTLIARSRFVAPVPHGKLLIISTYHSAQFLIVLGIAGAH